MGLDVLEAVKAFEPDLGRLPVRRSILRQPVVRRSPRPRHLESCSRWARSGAIPACRPALLLSPRNDEMTVGCMVRCARRPGSITGPPSWAPPRTCPRSLATRDGGCSPAWFDVQAPTSDVRGLRPDLPRRGPLGTAFPPERRTASRPGDHLQAVNDRPLPAPTLGAAAPEAIAEGDPHGCRVHRGRWGSHRVKAPLGPPS